MSETDPGNTARMPELEHEYGRVSVLDIETLTSEEVAFWKEKLLAFLRGLSDETFRKRFSTMPNEPTINRLSRDYENNDIPRKIVVVEREDQIIAAATLIDFSSKSIEVDTDSVAEIAVTVADDEQGQNLGTTLVDKTVALAVQDGKTHIYTSFEKSNKQSRKLFNRISAVSGLVNVAGKTNLEDRFWRLPNAIASEHIELEQKMQIYCGDIPADSETETEIVREKRRTALEKLVAWVLSKKITKS